MKPNRAFSLISIAIYASWSGAAVTFDRLPPFPLQSDYREKLREGDEFAAAPAGRITGDQFWVYPSENVPDPVLGEWNRRSTQIRHIRRNGDQLIFDAVYTYDQFGRRYTWEEKPASADRFLVLAGCSFTYGNGLNDDQTLNSFLARRLKIHYPYNYALGGTGPNVPLALIRSGRLQKEIPEKKGVFIYVSLNKHHADRAAGKLPSLEWLKHTPYFEKRDGRMVQNGDYRTGREWTTRFLLGYQKLRGFLGLDTRKIFPPFTQADYDYSCDLIRQMRDDFLAAYPGSQFYLLMHPQSDPQEMLSCYQRHRIPVIGDPVPWAKDPKYEIAGDGHPSAAANEKIASSIARVLEPPKE